MESLPLAKYCTCGSCSERGFDERGNIDYGQEWNEERGTYVVRDCEIARSRVGIQGGDEYLLECAIAEVFGR